MYSPIINFPKLQPTQKCERCCLRYPKKELQCTHCSNMSDQELKSFKLRIAEEQEGNANLGKVFLFISAICFILSLILFF